MRLTDTLKPGTRVTFSDWDRDRHRVVREGVVNGSDYETHLSVWVHDLNNTVAVAKQNVISVWERQE